MAVRLLRRRTLSLLCVLASIFGAVHAVSADMSWPSPSVRDSIEMVRIQQAATADGRVGAFSADGRWFAFVTWSGDLDRNVNVYRLMLLDVRRPAAAQTVLTREFVGDEHDAFASPFEQITFSNQRTIVYIGREAGRSQQVFSVDVETRGVTQLTHQPADVRQFVVDANGRVRLFVVLAESERDKVRSERLEQDGVLLSEESVLGRPKPSKVLSVPEPDRPSARRYFFQTGAGDTTPLYDPRQSRSATDAPIDDDRTLKSWATLTPNRQAQFALLFPYAGPDGMHSESNTTTGAWNNGLAAPYGLADLATGRTQRLLDLLHIPDGSASGSAPPSWAPDGRSVLLHVVVPDNVTAKGAAKDSPLRAQWVEVDLSTRRLASLNIPQGWKVMGWDGKGTGAVLNTDNHFALLSRRSAKWGNLHDLGTFDRVNWRWTPATNGEVVVGVAEDAQTPPELVSIDLQTKRITVLTDLNPSLRKRTYGVVEAFKWSHRYDDQASGFLIKPQAFDASKRYPLVVLLDDGNLKRIAHPYLLDGFMQLSGNAVQPLVAENFLVLYTREPRGLGGADECKRMQEHIHAAIEKLDSDGLIDSNRVGVSGWSRAGYHTNCILMDPRNRIAAASQIDGGGMEYAPRFRPYTDRELLSIGAPLLIEAHGLRSLTALSAMADRLDAFNRPTELLYFQSASHSTVRPQHRLRSLETHLEWWRFWLKGAADTDPGKREQLRRWNFIRSQWADAVPSRRSKEISEAGNSRLPDRDLDLDELTAAMNRDYPVQPLIEVVFE